MSFYFAFKRPEENRKSFWSFLHLFSSSSSSLRCFSSFSRGWAWIMEVNYKTEDIVKKTRGNICGRKYKKRKQHDTVRQLKAIIKFILIIGTTFSRLVALFSHSRVILATRRYFPSFEHELDLALFDYKVKLQVINCRAESFHQQSVDLRDAVERSARNCKISSFNMSAWKHFLMLLLSDLIALLDRRIFSLFFRNYLHSN